MAYDAKHWFWSLLNLTLVVAVLLGAVALKALYRYQGSLYPSRTINVSATGEAVAVPDIAQFSFSVVTEGESPEDVARENTLIMNAAIDFVKKQGVEDEDIKTSGYNLAPRYEYDRNRRQSFITGYTLTQTVSVKIRDFAKIGEILGALPGFGINQVSSLSFDIDDPDKLLNEAREEAFNKAREKAETMAEQNGVKIKRVVTFFESQGGYPPIPVYREAAFGMGGDFATAPAPSVEPGSQELTVNVSVTYEIR